MLKIHKNIYGLIFIFVFLPLVTFGATMKAGEEIILSESLPENDNLYVAAGTLTLNSQVNGDFYGVGGTVLLTADVRDDIVVAGGSVTLLGNGGEDVRVAGGTVLLAGNVEGELVAAGGTLTLAPGVVVKGDAVIAAGQTTISGDIMGDLNIAGGIVTVSGHVYGTVIARVEDTLTITDDAIIEGGIVYSAQRTDILTVSELARVTGEIIFEERLGSISSETEASTAAAESVWFIGTFVSFAITAIILVWLFRTFSHSLVRHVVERPLRMLGYGFTTLIMLPVAVLMLFVTVLGIPLGIIGLCTYGLLLVFSLLYTGVVAGAWLSQLFSKTDTGAITWKKVLAGTLLVTLLAYIPIIGWVIRLGIFLVTLGSITVVVYQKLWGKE